MQELVDIRNLTLACMVLNMFSIIACVVYMIWTKQSIMSVLLTDWDSVDDETDHIVDYTVIREGRIVRGLNTNTNNNPSFYEYYLSTPITDDNVVRDIVKHDRIMSIGFYNTYRIFVFVNPVWLHDPETLVIIDSLVNDAWIKLIEIKCKKSVDVLVTQLATDMGLDLNAPHRFFDSCTGPFYDFKSKPLDELNTKPATPTGTFHDGKPGVDTVDSPKINQSVFNDPDYGPVMKGKSHQNGIRSTILDDPEIDQISDKIGVDVAGPKNDKLHTPFKIDEQISNSPMVKNI